MAARAQVTHYADQAVDPTTGTFTITAYFMLADSATWPGQPAKVISEPGIVLDPSVGSWQSAIKTAIIARCATEGFTVSGANCLVLDWV
jgi:hypothetical protein